ncbi:hypothetical protein T261_7920 [Streptomyces lydicus]|nr:hypothetical protein T261_7920 [Streptomyces lydicus]
MARVELLRQGGQGGQTTDALLSPPLDHLDTSADTQRL